jgi:hypothetical protein
MGYDHGLRKHELSPLSAWGNTPIAFTAGLSPLTPDTTYHYQFVATNSAGVASTADLAFTTLGMFSSEGHVFTYARDNGAITIMAYSGPGGTVPIPGTIAGLPVAAIANSVFANLTTLTGVTLPNTVTSLGDSAFSGCSGLTSITLPNGLTNLGVATFSGCTNLQSATLPANLTGISDYAFNSCASLTAITIPDSITSIGSDAFSAATKLTDVTIPDSVTNLGAEAFFGCTSLASLTIGKGITSIRGGAENGSGGTFQNCTSLARVTIPDNVTNIGDGTETIGGPDGAFFYCTSLTNVTVGQGLTYLGLGAFSWCTNLAAVYFRGNAPTPGQSPGFGEEIFYGAPAIAYYLPGTTGWEPTFSTIHTALWNPQAQTSDASFGVRQNLFGFKVTGTADIPLVVEASINVAAQSWRPLQSCTLTNGLIYFSDPQWTNYPSRAYRIRSP